MIPGELPNFVLVFFFFFCFLGRISGGNSFRCRIAEFLPETEMAAVAENTIGSDIHRSSAAAAAETEYQRDVRKLVDLLSKLNPSAKEFFPSSYSTAAACEGRKPNVRLSADAPIFVASSDYNNNNQIGNGSNKDSSSDGSVNNQPNRRVRDLIPFSCFIYLFV